MLSDEDFRMLLQHLDRPWAGYRKVRKGVKKRLRRHMVSVGCRDLSTYLRMLETRPDIKSASESCLYVTISRFFRDRRLWQVMEERLFPQLFRDFGTPLRIWSAGCACGEEAYTIAILLSSYFKFEIGCSQVQCLPKPDLHILATDAQSVCLERARAGRFARSCLKETPEILRREYFSPLKGGRHFSVNFEKLPPIKWRLHHLITDSPPVGPFHMIFLRNSLLTYHQGPELHDAFERIVSVLAPGGWLVVGSHERIPASFHRYLRDEQCPWVYHFYQVPGEGVDSE